MSTPVIAALIVAVGLLLGWLHVRTANPNTQARMLAVGERLVGWYQAILDFFNRNWTDVPTPDDSPVEAVFSVIRHAVQGWKVARDLSLAMWVFILLEAIILESGWWQLSGGLLLILWGWIVWRFHQQLADIRRFYDELKELHDA